jgi:acetyltransferase-like isoleucine patch superfamily enzyme/dTDP-4-dehydrorhamnose 3,5-epimerase-like enzyme
MKDVFVHPQGLCETTEVGAGTRIWAYTHVLPDVRIGRSCNICDHVFIEGGVVIGDRVTVKCGVQLWTGITIEDDVFIGPNATFTNDRFPRSRQWPDEYEKTRVCAGASIGANATILPGTVVGARAMVGAGSVVTRSVPPNAIVVGNPARIIGYVDAKYDSVSKSTESSEQPVGASLTRVRGVTLHRLPLINDLRGDLSFGEFQRTVPFLVKRYFMVFNVPTAEVRGEHAHRTCHQFLIATHGHLSVVADDGTEREEFLLDRPNCGLYLPPMVWGIQYRYSADAVLLAFASEYYDPADYIRDYDAWLAEVKR